jgi:HK97 family phage portal protein
MGILSKTLREFRSDSSTLADPKQWLTDALGARPTASGAFVSEETAMRHAAVYACVRVLAEAIASLPLKTYQLSPDEDARREALTSDLYYVLHDLPNPEMTSFEMRETMQGHVLLWGNAYAYIERAAGRVVALWPLNPARMRVETNERAIRYTYQLRDGSKQVLTRAGGRSDVLHIKGLSADGLVGYSPIRLMREAIGLGLSVDEYGARLFKNSARPGGLISTDKKLGPRGVENVRESLNALHQGNANAHKIAVLEDGLKWQQIGINPNDAQFLETRKFQAAEIARIFRVPPHMIGDLDRATFSNIEQQSLEFVMYTLRPWLVRWEQAIARDVFGERQFYNLKAEFVVEGLLRGDIKTRMESYQIGRNIGLYSANDIRRKEGENPISDPLADKYNLNPPGVQKTNNDPGKQTNNDGQGADNGQKQAA